MDTTRLIKLHKPCSVFCDQPWRLPNSIFNIGGSSWGAEMAQWWPSPLTSLTRRWVCCWFSHCSEGFPPGSPVFLPPTKKATTPNSNSTRLEGLNENPLFLSLYFNSNFYFSFCNKDHRVSRGQKKFKCFLFQGGHWNVVLWNTGFSMISDEQLDNLVERFTMSDQSTEWNRESIGHVDPGDSRISWAVVRHPHIFTPMITSHPWWPLKI